MKRKFRIALSGALVVFGTVLQSHAQHLVQPLTVSLTAYDTVGNKVIRIGTKELIRYLAGTNVPNGRLYLVTPTGNPPGITGGLSAFLRITRGTNTVLEIPSPAQFNVYQDVAVLRTNGLTIFTRALNRFSFDTGSVRAELQGNSTWNISERPVAGVDVSGAGSFQSVANGWISIYNVTEKIVPINGIIVAGRPKPGP
ncbi:MAG: hypothetical protein H7Y36_00775 [Armatimonadetes bacterium]|nr:hypothetical protein [Akkermansiaceae bacterium]